MLTSCINSVFQFLIVNQIPKNNQPEGKQAAYNADANGQYQDAEANNQVQNAEINNQAQNVNVTQQYQVPNMVPNISQNAIQQNYVPINPMIDPNIHQRTNNQQNQLLSQNQLYKLISLNKQNQYEK